MRIEEIQQYLKDHHWDGWLLADFHGRNDVAMGLWKINSMLTRRAFYFIPAEGTPTALVNPVEADKFAGLPGQVIAYKGYVGLEEELGRLLKYLDETGLTELGYETIAGAHPVVPLMVRDTQRTSAVVAHLRANGILATGLNHPVVPRGDEEIRFQVSADHTEADVDQALGVLARFADRESG